MLGSVFYKEAIFNWYFVAKEKNGSPNWSVTEYVKHSTSQAGVVGQDKMNTMLSW